MNVRESYSRALEQGTLAECRILLGGRGRGEVGSCVVWCAFDGFRTTYLGISALHPFTSLIRRSNPTHNIHYKTDLHANHHAMHACEMFPLFPRNLRLDRSLYSSALFSIFSDLAKAIDFSRRDVARARLISNLCYPQSTNVQKFTKRLVLVLRELNLNLL